MAGTPLSKYMKMLRKQHGLTQKDLSDKLGITRGSYSHYETGFSQTPNDILDKLSRLYNVPLINFVKLSSMSGEDASTDNINSSKGSGIDGAFLYNPKSPSGDPLYIDFITNFPEMNERQLRDWLSPEDLEVVYNYHKLSSRKRRLATALIKTLVIYDS